MARITFTAADSVALSYLDGDVKIHLESVPKLGIRKGSPEARRYVEFAPRLFGYRSRNSMFAEAAPIGSNFSRFKSFDEIRDVVLSRLPDAFEKTFGIGVPPERATEMVNALAPAIKRFRVAQLAAGNPIDHLLISAGAPQFEYAAVSDTYFYGFRFQTARDNFADLPDGWDREKTDSEKKAYLNEHVVRPAWRPLEKYVSDELRPQYHVPVAVIGSDGFIVGITFMHTIHGGIVAGLCRTPKDVTTMQRNILIGYPADQHMDSDASFLETHTQSSVRTGGVSGDKATFIKINFRQAYAIAEKLKDARNGVRVPAPPGTQIPLLNARIRTQELIHGVNGKGYKALYFSMNTLNGGPAPTANMSLSGSMAYLSAQVYVRQHAWKDEADFPELFPAGRTTALPEDVTWMFATGDMNYTKVLPDYVRDFQERAEALLKRKLSRGEGSKALQDAAQALAEQRALMTPIIEVEKSAAEAQEYAAMFRLKFAWGEITE